VCDISHCSDIEERNNAVWDVILYNRKRFKVRYDLFQVPGDYICRLITADEVKSN
jgi:hypothetical protein